MYVHENKNIIKQQKKRYEKCFDLTYIKCTCGNSRRYYTICFYIKHIFISSLCKLLTINNSP